MKLKEVQELKAKPVAELEKLLKESREKLRVLRFDLVAGKVKDVAELRSVRRNIGRIQTFLNQEKK
ncbi:MAG: 50S ribosomal protein L29 [Patescibacteria group bacterium]